MNKKYDGLGGLIKEQNNKISGLGRLIEEQNNKIGGLGGLIEDQNGKISGLSGIVEEQNNKISGLSLKMLSLEKQMKAVWERVNLLPTKDEFFGKMDEVITELKTVRGQQEFQSHQISRHEERITKLEGAALVVKD